MKNRNHPLPAQPIAQQILTLLMCLWFAVSSSLGVVAHAQSDDSNTEAPIADVEAPVIEHEEIASSIAGNVESFVATVIDDVELEGVSLFYRYAGDTQFIVLNMQQLADSAYYTATIDTSLREGNDTAIEYYIQAKDTAGNLVLKGFAFEPLIRKLDNRPIEEPAVVINSAPVKSEPSSKINWLYVGLGALLIGGIAAAGGSSEDGGISEAINDGECSPNCNVTLTFSTP